MNEVKITFKKNSIDLYKLQIILNVFITKELYGDMYYRFHNCLFWKSKQTYQSVDTFFFLFFISLPLNLSL